VERKVVQHIECSEGDIRAAIVLDVQYPKANRAKIALRVADGTVAGTWVLYFKTLYDDNLVEQPEGEVGLYISDFIGPAGLPTAFCRPSAAETAAGVQRFVFQLLWKKRKKKKLTPNRDPQVILTYDRLRKIFLKARAIHQGTYEPGDGEEDNVYAVLVSAERERAERERERADITTYHLAILEERERERAERERERYEPGDGEEDNVYAVLESAERERERAERERERADITTYRLAILEEREREQELQIAMLQEQVRQLQRQV
jgi:hypothetical protein